MYAPKHQGSGKRLEGCSASAVPQTLLPRDGIRRNGTRDCEQPWQKYSIALPTPTADYKHAPSYELTPLMQTRGTSTHLICCGCQPEVPFRVPRWQGLLSA